MNTFESMSFQLTHVVFSFNTLHTEIHCGLSDKTKYGFFVCLFVFIHLFLTNWQLCFKYRSEDIMDILVATGALSVRTLLHNNTVFLSSCWVKNNTIIFFCIFLLQGFPFRDWCDRSKALTPQASAPRPCKSTWSYRSLKVVSGCLMHI